MKKSVFLTGATGFLGKRILNDLVTQGHHVYILVRPKHGRSPVSRIQELINPQYSHLVTLVEGDLTQDGAGIKENQLGELMDQIDLFIHSAALVKFGNKYEDSHNEINVEGTRRAIEVAKKLRIPQFYHVSTAYTTGEVMEAQEIPHSIDRNFHNSYEKSKCLTEKLVLESADEQFNVAIFRPSVIIGDSVTGAADTNISMYGLIICIQRFIEKMGQSLNREGTYRVLADPNCGGNMVPVNLVSETILLAMEQNIEEGIYHITNPRTVSIDSILSTISRNLEFHDNFLIAEKDLTEQGMTEAEKMLNHTISAFLIYMNKGPVFYNPNTMALYGRKPKYYTSINDEMFDFIIGTYLNDQRKKSTV
ncbi:SDR family oxidoreductase [Bacillus carboniphilus]|uniref:SDR family oxidoreductase n=1 Tax=Bacillus carboniphilus TaxID=86663 RepID=A0ABY9JWP5_9BACI|nr:SDR family oxidoreductase [Bacillus carboniphilus]WLR43822.1 SDR family oxidoreductase [Bacillus carboniphilus]